MIHSSVKNSMTVQIQEVTGREQSNGPGMKQIQPKSERNKIRSAWSFDKCWCENEAIVKSSEKLNCCKRTKRKSCKIFSFFFPLCIASKGKERKEFSKASWAANVKKKIPHFLCTFILLKYFLDWVGSTNVERRPNRLSFYGLQPYMTFTWSKHFFDSQFLLRMVSID